MSSCAEEKKAEDVTADDEMMSAGLLFAHLSPTVPAFALKSLSHRAAANRMPL